MHFDSTYLCGIFCSIFDVIRYMSELGLEYVERNKYTRSFAFMLNDKTANESEAKKRVVSKTDFRK